MGQARTEMIDNNFPNDSPNQFLAAEKIIPIWIPGQIPKPCPLLIMECYQNSLFKEEWSAASDRKSREMSTVSLWSKCEPQWICKVFGDPQVPLTQREDSQLLDVIISYLWLWSHEGKAHTALKEVRVWFQQLTCNAHLFLREGKEKIFLK